MLGAVLVLVVLVGCEAPAGEDGTGTRTAGDQPGAVVKPAIRTVPPTTTSEQAHRLSARERTPASVPTARRTGAPLPATTPGPVVATLEGQTSRQGTDQGTPSPQAARWFVITHYPEELHVCRPDESLGRWRWQDFVQWSPDGATILFSRGPQLFGVTADGSRVWPVADAGTTTVLGEAGTTIPFDFSPDGTRVVFATCRYGKPNPEIPRRIPGAGTLRVERLGYELALVNVDGTDPQRLTTNDLEFDSFPAWSPDGRRIAHLYAEYGLGAYGLAVTPLDGSQPLEVTLPPKPGSTRESRPAPQTPAWSPDGRHLAVRADHGAVYLVDVEGGAARQIAPHSPLATNVVGGPAWSPDGRRLAVLKTAGRDFTLVTFDVDGREARWLATFRGQGVGESSHGWLPTVAWSPNGSKILVIPEPGRPGRAGRRAEDEADVYMVTAAGFGRGQVVRIVHSFSYVYAAAWAPEGERLALAAMEDLAGNDRRWSAGPRAWSSPEPTRWGDVRVYTLTPGRSDWRLEARRGHDGRLEAWNPPRPDDLDQLAACRAGGAVSDAANNPDLVDDCAALLALWTRLKDSTHANWTDERPLGTWEGVALGGTPPRVHGLQVNGSWLSGRDARALRWLTELRRLDLRNVGLGYISRELGQLEHLEELRLAQGGHRGRIRAELGQLTKLRVLDLSHNELTESIPAELGQLAALTHLDLSRNELTGLIPAELGQLRNLAFLDLSHNQLTGPIPVELSQLAGLREVRLAGNPLTGCVPAGLPVVDREALGVPECGATGVSGVSIRVDDLVDRITYSIVDRFEVQVSYLDAAATYDVVVSSSNAGALGIGGCGTAAQTATVTGASAQNLYFIVYACGVGAGTVTAAVRRAGAETAEVAVSQRMTVQPIPDYVPADERPVKGAAVAQVGTPGIVPNLQNERWATSFKMTWGKPSDGGLTLSGYGVLMWKGSAEQPGWDKAESIPPTPRSKEYTGLELDTLYKFLIHACDYGEIEVNDVATCGWLTEIHEVRTGKRPAPPHLISFDEKKPTSVRVTWSAAADTGGVPLTGFLIEYWPEANATELTTVMVDTADSRSEALTGLTPDTEYEAKLRTCNDLLSCTVGNWSATHAFRTPPETTPTHPGKVGQPTVAARDGALYVEWTAPEDGGAAISHHDIRYRRITSGGLTQTRVPPTDDEPVPTNMTVSGLGNGVAYQVEVRACNVHGCGYWSNEGHGTPAAMPPG